MGMDNSVREKLKELIATDKYDLLSDIRKLKGLLLDHCPKNRKEIEAILIAFSERIPEELTKSRDELNKEILVPRLTKKILDATPMSEEAAYWAVESWLLALKLDVMDIKPHVQLTISPEKVPNAHLEQLPTVNLIGKNIFFVADQLWVMLTPDVEMVFVRIPAGEFLMGSSTQVLTPWEYPEHMVYLDEYWIGIYPVTNRQYQAFSDAMNQQGPNYWLKGSQANHPVTSVRWDDAISFCQWVCQITGLAVRIPTEAEWEKAARGTDRRIYPWGNERPDKNRCNWDSSHTTPVGKYSPQGDSPYGCSDMAGNVQEWVNDWFDSAYYSNSPTHNPLGPKYGTCRGVRGGSYSHIEKFLSATARQDAYQWDMSDRIGFRCVALLGNSATLSLAHNSLAYKEIKDALDTAIRLNEWQEAERLVGELTALSPNDAALVGYHKRVMRELLRERKQTRTKHKAEERAKREAEEKAKREAEEKARRERMVGNEMKITLTHGVEMEFVRVAVGEFMMGSDNTNDKAINFDQNPQHMIFLDEYWIGKYPVTNRQYQAFVQTTKHSPPKLWQYGFRQEETNHPITEVSWEDAIAFCQWVSQIVGQPVRLPTEAEWEKAARGTDGRIYPWGNQFATHKHCNYDKNFGWDEGETTIVGRYSPQGDSPYGCADMAGNVWEWVNDWYDASYYANSPAQNPSGPMSGEYRVMRGGSWLNSAASLHVAYRSFNKPTTQGQDIGFRCVALPKR